MAKSYTRTTIGCFVGIFTQAVITNLTPILFVPMMGLYGFDYKQLGILVGINFIAQIAADILFSKAIDRIGYRKVALPTCIIALIGLLLFGFAPFLFRENIYVGIIIATIVFAFSSGLLEVILSPIVAAIPSNNGGAAMSLMHSFYAWGQAATIILTTLALFLFGSQNWQYIVLAWAIVPLVSFLIFAGAPFPENVPEEKRQTMSQLIFQPFYILALVAIFAGAGAELVMNQWSSTFMEKGLQLPKLWGDLLGMCGFAIMLGVGRTLYGIFGAKLDISKVMIGGAFFAMLCYITVAFSTFTPLNILACALCGIATSLLWPGTIVVASEKYPLAGAWLFAILAAGGDIGGAIAPWMTGTAIDNVMQSDFIIRFAAFLQVPTEQAAIRFGLLVAAIFPAIAFVCHIFIRKKRT